jgi:diaminopimelate decarboxylase
MANPAPQILTRLADEGVGACVNSIPHLRLVLDAGIPVAHIQYTASGLSLDQMGILIEAGVRVDLDSRRQIQQWLAMGGAPFGVRLNAGSLIGLEGDRLGVDAAELDVLLDETALDLIEGVHVYVGTNFLHSLASRVGLRPFATSMWAAVQVSIMRA